MTKCKLVENVHQGIFVRLTTAIDRASWILTSQLLTPQIAPIGGRRPVRDAFVYTELTRLLFPPAILVHGHQRADA